ncbi:MAG: hypothetical protein KatS3mg027_1434 [Bacteroidia bacterium]|nr:MAG: hypothetical protein KatS3mg027_1434 [Bacteroidia bacterium]
MKKIIVAFIMFSLFFVAFRDKDKDPLHKRIFNTNITEIKSGVPTNKIMKDELEFKDGKVFSNFLNDKFNVSWLKYVIEKDTSYVDSITEAQVRYFEIKASVKNEEKEETTLFCKIENENIEGEIKIMKNDKLKKHFEFSGSEKATKIKDKK